MGYNKLTSLSANIKAIETAVAIHSQGRTATQEEKQVLAQYSGFGGIKDVLDLGTDKPLDKEVAGLLNRLLDAFIRKRPHIIAQSMTKMQGQLLLVENVISSLQISGYNLIKNYDCKPK